MRFPFQLSKSIHGVWSMARGWSGTFIRLLGDDALLSSERFRRTRIANTGLRFDLLRSTHF